MNIKTLTLMSIHTQLSLERFLNSGENRNELNFKAILACKEYYGKKFAKRNTIAIKPNTHI